MTTEAGRARVSSRLGRCCGALLCALLATACAESNKARRGDQVDVTNYPPEIRAAYQVFASRCSRCHTLARPLNARISDPQHWVRYVNRMRLQPGSGIDAQNGAIILRFLHYYHGERTGTVVPSGKPRGAHD